MKNPKLMLALYVAAVLVALVALVVRTTEDGSFHYPSATIAVLMAVLGESYRRKLAQRGNGSRA